MRKVFQFKIILLGSDPVIWRKIQISDLCTFWSLHAAVTDAMGWLDYHLHEFIAKNPVTTETEHIGYPDDEGILFEEMPEPVAGWKLRVRDYLDANKTMLYNYDFGDGWEHLIEFEGVFDKIPGIKYPVCLAGENACPPEDVGGLHGYVEFLEAIKNKKHPEYKSYLEWVGGKFTPSKFDAKKVKFTNANTRLNSMLEGV